MSREELKATRARERLAVLIPDLAAGAEALRHAWATQAATDIPLSVSNQKRMRMGALRDLAQSIERDARTIDALLAKLDGGGA